MMVGRSYGGARTPNWTRDITPPVLLPTSGVQIYYVRNELTVSVKFREGAMGRGANFL